MNKNEIKKIIAAKISEGLSLSDIQKILADEHNQKMTFLELRLIASEIEALRNKPEPAAEEEPENAGEDQTENIDDDLPETEGAAIPFAPEEEEETGSKQGGCVVEVSKLVRPGAVVSGSVKFASGVSAEWMVDQMGRLGLNNVKGGQPTEDDIKDFQVELQNVLGQGH